MQNNEIVVKQGQPGGVLWFHPRVVDQTGVTTSQLLPTDVAQIRAGVQEPSLAGGASATCANLHNEYVSVQNAKTSQDRRTTTTDHRARRAPALDHHEHVVDDDRHRRRPPTTTATTAAP